jgi:hypothetical protein
MGILDKLLSREPEDKPPALSIAERLRSSDDPLGELYGWSPLDKNRLEHAMRLSDADRAEAILRLAESDDFYALVAHVIVFGAEGAAGMKVLSNALRAAIRSAELQQEGLNAARNERLTFKEKAFARIGFRGKRRQPWAGLSTGYTDVQLAEIERRSKEGGDEIEAT